MHTLVATEPIKKTVFASTVGRQMRQSVKAVVSYRHMYYQPIVTLIPFFQPSLDAPYKNPRREIGPLYIHLYPACTA